MVGLRFITHLETFPVIAQFHKLVSGDAWAGRTALARMSDEALPHNTLLLRVQNKPSLENWLDDLPMHDQPEFDKWKSMKAMLSRARKAIFADPMMREAADAGAPMGRVVISVLKPDSVMAWHRDLGDYAKHHLRFHIPLLTNPRCTTYCGAEQLHLPVGALVYLNALEQHCSANWGATARAHVIFELRRRDAPEAE